MVFAMMVTGTLSALAILGLCYGFGMRPLHFYLPIQFLFTFLVTYGTGTYLQRSPAVNNQVVLISLGIASLFSLLFITARYYFGPLDKRRLGKVENIRHKQATLNRRAGDNSLTKSL